MPNPTTSPGQPTPRPAVNTDFEPEFDALPEDEQTAEAAQEILARHGLKAR